MSPLARRSRRALALVSLGLASLLTPRPSQAQQDTALAEIAVQVEIERGPSELFVGLARDSAVLLPVHALLDLAELRVDTVVPGIRLLGRFGAERDAFGFDTQAGRAFRGRLALPLDSSVAVWRDGILYVATAVLGGVLDVDVTVSWPDLLVLVGRADSLPVIQRLRRDRQRGAALRRAQPASLPPLLPARDPVADGLVLDWATTFGSRQPEENHTVQLGLGAAVVGGSLEVQHVRSRTPIGTQSDSRWQWHGAWPERRWVRQARVGEIGAGGPRGAAVRGAAISNAPFLRPAGFGEFGLRGIVPPGWEVELYRGEELLAFTETDASGRFLIDVPVIYGPNPLAYVAYGPRGEVRRYGRSVRVPFERLPARRLEYSAGGGECLLVTCAGAANLDLRYGLSQRVTMQAGYDRFWRDSLDDLDHPYALVAVQPLAALGLQVEGVANALARARLDVDPNPDFHLNLGHARYATGLSQPIISPPATRHQSDAGLFWRPRALGGYTFVQGTASHSVGASATGASPPRRTTARMVATTRLLGARASAGMRGERERPPGGAVLYRAGLELGADGVLNRVPPALRGTYLRAGLETACEEAVLCDGMVSRVAVSASRTVLRTWRLDLQGRKDRGVRGVSLDVTVSVAQSWLRATSRNSYARALGVTGQQVLEGSLLWDRRQGRLGASAARSLGRGVIAGVVFLDANANGRRDPGEAGLPDVLLRVGTDAVASDSAGRFAVWDLVPFEGTVIEVDSLGLPNPLWVPLRSALRLAAGPNSFRFLEVPIQEGAEVSGRVVLDGRPVGGARVTFVSLETGRTRDATTFSDGTFYVLGLVAGEYDVLPAPGLLEQLRARAEPLRVQIGREGSQRVDGLVIQLRRE